MPFVLRKLCLSVAALLCLALAAEGYLRCFRPVTFRMPGGAQPEHAEEWNGLIHRRGSAPGILYELAPGLDTRARGMHVQTNSLGLRCEEPLDPATPGLVRIAVVGDSLAFGFGVDQGQDFPAQLERELGDALAPELRVEVLNFGVCGYSTQDELAVLREKVLPARPDLVVLQYCLNDPEWMPLQPLQAHFRDVEWWQHSAALRLVASRLHGRAIAKYGGGSQWRALHNPAGPFWQPTARALDGIAALCRERGVPLVAVVLPMLPGAPYEQPVTDYRYADLHEFVIRELGRREVPALDLRTALCARAPRELLIAPDDMHFNAAGNALIARELRAWLAPRLGP